MIRKPCDYLSDYLDRDLSGEAEQLFLAHLPACATCSIAVAEQRRLETVLSGAVEQLDCVPANLVANTRRRIRTASRRRYLTLAAGVSAAAAIVWWLLGVSRPAGQPSPPGSGPPVQVAGESTRPPEIRITFADESKLLVVPEKTDSPDVTFLWVYRNQRATH